MSIVGENIRALREREGLTQQEFADAIHVSRETVNKWESGLIESVRERNLAVMRARFGVSVDDLRSEHKGISAQLRAHEAEGTVPIHPLGATLPTGEPPQAPMSDILWRKHPQAFAIEMDSSMSRVLPCGCVAFVDPQVAAGNGSIVLAAIATVDGPRLAVRRLHLGSTKAMLSAESYEGDLEDVVVDVERLDIRGTVFWYQASGELV